MTNLKQTELFPMEKKSTLLQEDTLANLSPSQVEKKVKKIRDTSGQSILDLSKSSGQIGLLEKTLLGTLNSVSTPYSRTWKLKVTPQGRLVFQLRASVQTTKEKESGLWQTPTAVGIQERSQEALEKKMKKRLATGRKTVPPGSLTEQIKFSPNKDQKPKWNMWRTPDNMAGGSNLPGIQKALDEGHLKRPSGQPIQIRLQDQVKEKRLWPTPTATERSGINPKTGKGAGLSKTAQMWPTPTVSHALRGNHEEPIEKYQQRVKDYEEGRAKGKPGKSLGVAVRMSPKKWPTPTANEDAAGRPGGKMQKMLGNHPDVRGTGGGTLSPIWVEWLMGYPSGWTDLNVSETVWCHPSPITSDSVSSPHTWPTPMKGDAHLSSTKDVAKKRIEEGKVTLSRAVQSGMWPTPMARSHSSPRLPETMAKTGRNPLTNTLEDAVQYREIEKRNMWPTPTREAAHHRNKVPPSIGKTRGYDLTMKVFEEEEKKKMWPTPTNQSAGKGKMLDTLITKDGEKAKRGERAYNPKTGKHVQITLDRAVKMWPTPLARDVKDLAVKPTWKENLQSNLPREVMKEEEKKKKWPTPRATDYFPGVGKYVEETSTGYAVIRKKTRRKFGAKLADAVDYEERKNKNVEDTDSD